MAQPSEAERKKTRKLQLAAEAVFLLLLMRAAKKSRGAKAALVQALLDGQNPLRQLARDRLLVELRVKKPPTGGVFRSTRAPTKAEQRRAASLASSFIEFRDKKLRMATTSELKKLAETAIDSRIRLLAANEAVRVLEEERRKAAETVVGVEKAVALKRWDASNDALTCMECSSLDDTEIPIEEEFPQGDPPLHPNCRCSIEYSFDS